MQRLLRVSEAGVDSPEVMEGERLAGFIARGAGALQLLGVGVDILLGVVGGRGVRERPRLGAAVLGVGRVSLRRTGVEAVPGVEVG